MPPAFSGTARAVRCMDAEISGRYRNGSRRTASIRSRKQVALSNRLRSCLIQPGFDSGKLLFSHSAQSDPGCQQQTARRRSAVGHFRGVARRSFVKT